MNLPSAIVEAQRRFGPNGHAREFPQPTGAGLLRQVGIQVDSVPTLVIMGEGGSFEDAFLRAVPGEALLDLPGGEPLGSTPQRIVYAGGADLRLPVRHLEALNRLLEGGDEIRDDDDGRLQEIGALVQGALVAIHQAQSELPEYEDPRIRPARTDLET